MDSADRLRALLRAPDSQAETLILDLRGVSFIDSSGLSVVVGEHQRAKAEQFRFAVAIGGARQVDRLVELCGLRGTVATVEDPDTLPIG